MATETTTTDSTLSTGNQIDKSMVTLVGGISQEPKIGLYFINDHVLNLDAKLLQTKDELEKSNRHLSASLKDIQKTKQEISELAQLGKGQWATKMLFNLNRLQTNLCEDF